MNKLSKLILMLPLALAPLAGQAAPKGGSHAALAAGFVAPPDSVQTSVYWYWLSGNVSKEGVVKDLEAMKRAGINRAFIGNIGLGELATPYAPVKLFTDEWWEVTHAALKRASGLGIEIGMFNSPGWSQAGGPWIEPGQAMRYLASVKAHVRGGAMTEIRNNAEDCLMTLVRETADNRVVAVMNLSPYAIHADYYTGIYAGMYTDAMTGEPYELRGRVEEDMAPWSYRILCN